MSLQKKNSYNLVHVLQKNLELLPDQVLKIIDEPDILKDLTGPRRLTNHLVISLSQAKLSLRKLVDILFNFIGVEKGELNWALEETEILFKEVLKKRNYLYRSNRSSSGCPPVDLNTFLKLEVDISGLGQTLKRAEKQKIRAEKRKIIDEMNESFLRRRAAHKEELRQKGIILFNPWESTASSSDPDQATEIKVEPELYYDTVKPEMNQERENVASWESIIRENRTEIDLFKEEIVRLTKKVDTEIKAEPELYYDNVKPEMKLEPESEINVKSEMKVESSDPTMYEDVFNNTAVVFKADKVQVIHQTAQTVVKYKDPGQMVKQLNQEREKVESLESIIRENRTEIDLLKEENVKLKKKMERFINAYLKIKVEPDIKVEPGCLQSDNVR